MRAAQTRRRVEGVAPDLRTRFRHRAERRRDRLNQRVPSALYRWEVVPDRGRWAVVAMQNVAEPPA